MAVFLASVWLFFGGSVKLLSAWVDPAPEIMGYVSRLATAWISCFELLLATFLLFRLWPRFTKPIVVLMLFLFATIHAAILAGWIASCGCFGALITSSWLMLLVNFFLFLFLLISPSPEPWWTITWRRNLRIVFILFFSAVALVASVRHPMLVTTEKTARNPDRIGRILSSHTSLLTGKWMVVFGRSGCGRCEEEMPLFLSMIDSAAMENGYQICFVNLSTDGRLDNQWRVGLTNVLIINQPDATIPTPLILFIESGQVIRSQRSLIL